MSAPPAPSPGQPPQPPPGPPGPTHTNPLIQTKMTFRPTDVIISVPPKSGTTWTMNIVYQLREHGNRNFDEIYEEVIWMEIMKGPTSTIEEMVQRMEDMPLDRPRAFKTHSSPGERTLPYHRDKCKYVVVVRNPEEALVSLKSFLVNFSPEFRELWKLPPQMFDFPDFETFYDMAVRGMGADKREFFSFVVNWWEKRHNSNVLMMHYTDMIKDHEGSIRKISEFLGYGPYAAEEWETIMELTSFPWMKKHEMKFEAKTVWEVPCLKRGGMVRQGSFGLARNEGITEEMAKELKERGREVLFEGLGEVEGAKALEWMYNGGEC